MENFNNNAASSGTDGDSTNADAEDSPVVAKAKKEKIEPVDFTYTERDVILYNLGIGATEKDLQWTFEADDRFNALPSFGVVPQFMASAGVSYDWLPNFNPVGNQTPLRLFVTLLT